LFDGVELKLFDRKLTPETIFGFLSRMDDWPRKDVKFDELFWPPTDVEIQKMLTPEALREWDFDIFRLIVYTYIKLELTNSNCVLSPRFLLCRK